MNSEYIAKLQAELNEVNAKLGELNRQLSQLGGDGQLNNTTSDFDQLVERQKLAFSIEKLEGEIAKLTKQKETLVQKLEHENAKSNDPNYQLVVRAARDPELHGIIRRYWEKWGTTTQTVWVKKRTGLFKTEEVSQIEPIPFELRIYEERSRLWTNSNEYRVEINKFIDEYSGMNTEYRHLTVSIIWRKRETKDRHAGLAYELGGVHYSGKDIFYSFSDFRDFMASALAHEIKLHR